MDTIMVPTLSRLTGLLYLKKIPMEFFLATSFISDAMVPTRTSPLSKWTQVPQYWRLQVLWRPRLTRSKLQVVQLLERVLYIPHMRAQVGSCIDMLNLSITSLLILVCVVLVSWSSVPVQYIAKVSPHIQSSRATSRSYHLVPLSWSCFSVNSSSASRSWL